jgi:phosphonate transport system substrate-binding protein
MISKTGVERKMKRFQGLCLQSAYILVLAALLCIPAAKQSFAEESKPLSIAMTAAFVSEKGTDVYGKISEYLHKKAGLETDFLTGLSYSTVNSMVENGAADIAFVCGYPYIMSHDGKENPPMKLLAAPVMESPLYEDKPIYYSYTIVPLDSTAQSFKDLKGKRYVYNDKGSNSGYNLPRAKLIELGETNGFFSEVMQSGSHEESIRMVAEGKTDASSVDSLVLDYMLLDGDESAKKVKIIDKLGPAGIPPVVYSSSLAPEKAEKIKDALLHMHEDPEGAAILKEAHVKKFVAVDDTVYDDVRKFHKMAVDANFMEIK